MNEDADLRLLIERIEQAFGRDADAWLANFDNPLVLIAPEATLVFDRGVARDHFNAMFADLKSQGFASTKADRVLVRVVADDMALIDAHFTRRRTDGSVLEQLAALYTCRRTDGQWRVAALLRHPYETEAVTA